MMTDGGKERENDQVCVKMKRYLRAKTEVFRVFHDLLPILVEGQQEDGGFLLGHGFDLSLDWYPRISTVSKRVDQCSEKCFIRVCCS
jgi:hypothetical protein